MDITVENANGVFGFYRDPSDIGSWYCVESRSVGLKAYCIVPLAYNAELSILARAAGYSTKAISRFVAKSVPVRVSRKKTKESKMVVLLDLTE